MTTTRQDAWSPDDDLLLAEVILRHIREGSTQLAAFEEVGEKLGRTAAACGFRWNSSVRKQYEAAIQIAKSQRQKRPRMKNASVSLKEDLIQAVSPEVKEELDMDPHTSFDDVIRFLKNMKQQHADFTKRLKDAESGHKLLNEELLALREENAKLKKRYSSIENDYQVVNDDYKTLLQIMDRARKMTLLTDSDEYEIKPKFKMDANGNLERVER